MLGEEWPITDPKCSGLFPFPVVEKCPGFLISGLFAVKITGDIGDDPAEDDREFCPDPIPLSDPVLTGFR